MKLAELVSVFPKEVKHKHFTLKQGQNFISDVSYLLFAVWYLKGYENWTCYYIYNKLVHPSVLCYQSTGLKINFFVWEPAGN